MCAINTVAPTRRCITLIQSWHQNPFPTTTEAQINGMPLTSKSMQQHRWRRLAFWRSKWESTSRVFLSSGIRLSDCYVRILRIPTAWRCHSGCNTISTSRYSSWTHNPTIQISSVIIYITKVVVSVYLNPSYVPTNLPFPLANLLCPSNLIDKRMEWVDRYPSLARIWQHKT